MKRFLACLLCLICGGVCAKEVSRSSDADIIAGYVAEWGNTRTAQAECSRMASQSSAKSHCRSLGNVDIYYLASTIAHLGAKNMLPKPLSRYFEGTNQDFNIQANFRKEFTSIAVQMSF